VADYSQIELRVAALVSQDPVMLEAYEKGEDLHRKTAAAVAGVTLGQVTKEQRQAAKAINFGLLYGQGAEGLAQYAKQSYGVEMSIPEARRAKEAFFRT
jgi:DNA polymerase I-like protein with 3'-5' exonuclease and polymerase domains